MLRIPEQLLKNYDDIISEPLSKAMSNPPRKSRKGLGRHGRKDDPLDRFCHGRKIRKRGFRHHPKTISTVFGKVLLPLRVAECYTHSVRYSLLFSDLGLTTFVRKEDNFEHVVIETVIDTNYRRLIEGRSIDIFLGGIHNIVVGSDIEKLDEMPIELDDFSTIMADGTGVKQQKGKNGELRTVIGIRTADAAEPLGTFVNAEWSEMERIIKERIKRNEASGIPFIYNGERGLDNFLSDLLESQRCTWHGPRGLYHVLWEDGLRKKDSQPESDKLRHLIGIEIPQEVYEILKQEDKDQVERQYESSKAEIDQLRNLFKTKGDYNNAAYL